MAAMAIAVQESFEDRQTNTAEALEELLEAVKRDQERKAKQAEKGLDALSFFICERLQAEGYPNAEAITERIRKAFEVYPHWRNSKAELRELRKQVTFALYAAEEDLAKVGATVESLFSIIAP